MSTISKTWKQPLDVGCIFCTVKTLHTCGIYFGGVDDMLALYKTGDMLDTLTSDIAHMDVGGAEVGYIFWGHNNVCY